MMKITGLAHLFKWENLHNWWLTKYFFAPLYLSRIPLPESVFACVSVLECVSGVLERTTVWLPGELACWEIDVHPHLYPISNLHTCPDHHLSPSKALT